MKKKLVVISLMLLSLTMGVAVGQSRNNSRDAVVRCNSHITEDMVGDVHLVDYRAEGEIVFRCDKRGF